jgi:hypothetical protein
MAQINLSTLSLDCQITYITAAIAGIFGAEDKSAQHALFSYIASHGETFRMELVEPTGHNARITVSVEADWKGFHKKPNHTARTYSGGVSWSSNGTQPVEHALSFGNQILKASSIIAQLEAVFPVMSTLSFGDELEAAFSVWYRARFDIPAKQPKA